MIDYERLWRHADRCGWCGLVATGRAGSDAFQSQLDSHPEIFGFNGILLFYEFWANAHTTHHPKGLNAGDIAEEFVGTHIDKFRSHYDVVERKDRLGDNMDQSIDIDIAGFKAHMAGLFAHREVTPKNFLTAIYVAYALSLNQDPFAKKIFFHHIHNVSRLGPFLHDFPDAKIIATTRDPRAGYVSKMEQVRREGTAVDQPTLPRLALMRLIDEPTPLFALGDRFRVIRMEDLSSESAMRIVCSWLGVAYDPCVMKSTWAGLRWWGDNLSPIDGKPGMDEQEFLRRIRNNNWQTKLNGIEKYVLDFILRDRLDWCGYARVPRHTLVHGLIAFLVIPVPMTYEWKFLAPGYLWNCICRGRVSDLIAISYAYIRRVAYYYRLHLRVMRGGWLDLPYFGSPERRSAPVAQSNVLSVKDV